MHPPTHGTDSDAQEMAAFVAPLAVPLCPARMLHCRNLRLPSLARRPPRACIQTATILTEGDVVAILRGTGAVRAELGLVTGTDSSGRNVDFAPLKAFVPELYVRDDRTGATFARADRVRRVPATWVPQQQGWIVLDSDVAAAKADIDATAASMPSAVPAAFVEVREAKQKVIADPAPRSLFRPTRRQAYIGAALSIPVSAIAYAVFASERAAFSDSTGALQDAALVVSAVAAVLSLIVGGALFLYATNLPKGAQ